MDYERLINEYELLECADVIRPHLLPCVGFSLQLAESPAPVGSSRVGGGPDLPPDFVLPRNNDRPLDFVMQVNLEDAAPHDRANILPKSGLLTFFWDIQNQSPSYDPQRYGAFATLYFPTGTRLARRPAEANGLAPIFQLPEHTATFWPGWTVPHPFSRTADQMDEQLEELEQELGDDYWEFCKAVALADAPPGQKFLHRLGGHSHNVQGDMQLKAQLVTNGFNLGSGIDKDDPRYAALEADCEEWRMLLQLDSDERFFFNDSGMLYYWIKSGDLAALDFTQMWMTEQSC